MGYFWPCNVKGYLGANLCACLKMTFNLKTTLKCVTHKHYYNIYTLQGASSVSSGYIQFSLCLTKIILIIKFDHQDSSSQLHMTIRHKSDLVLSGPIKTTETHYTSLFFYITFDWSINFYLHIIGFTKEVLRSSVLIHCIHSLVTRTLFEVMRWCSLRNPLSVRSIIFETIGPSLLILMGGLRYQIRLRRF